MFETFNSLCWVLSLSSRIGKSILPFNSLCWVLSNVLMAGLYCNNVFQFPLLGSSKVFSVEVRIVADFQFPLLGSTDTGDSDYPIYIAFQFPLLGSSLGSLLADCTITYTFNSLCWVLYFKNAVFLRRSKIFQFPLLGSTCWTGWTGLREKNFQFPLLGSGYPQHFELSYSSLCFQFPLLGSDIIISFFGLKRFFP